MLISRKAKAVPLVALGSFRRGHFIVMIHFAMASYFAVAM